MTLSSKRAEYVAIVSLILGVIFFAVAFLLGNYTGFYALNEIAWFSLAAVVTWCILFLQFHQRALAEQERLDMSQTAQQDQKTIFQQKMEGQTLFAVAQRRLKLLEKWVVPVVGFIIAAYLIAIGFLLYKRVPVEADLVDLKQPLVAAVAMIAIAFFSFLMSRYATGLAQQSIYNPLRAGGSFFLGLTVLCFAAAVGLALWQFKIVAVLSIMNRVVPVILIVLGFEILINGVFDIYRPRIEGLYSRASFDSRILGIINEPGRVFKTAAGAIDYQFGFNVSETWFYKLLEKAIIPLVLFSSAILYLMSSFVVIAPDEKAVIEHFGNSVDVQGNKRILEPGLAIKWPWPIDIVRKYPVKKVKQVNIGFVPALKPDGSIDIKPRLWEKSHYKKEYNLLVATPQSDTQSDESGAIPVSLIRAAVPVQYVVNDIYAFLYNHQKPQQVLEDICYRELTRFAAASRIEADEDENLEKSLLGAGRAPARKILSANIQAAADAANLGIKVVFVGLEGIHPPPEVALDYQKVVGAVQKKQALILNAHAIRNLQLSELAGSVDAANDLYKLVGQYQDARMQKDDKKIDLLAKELDDAFANAKGDIFKKLRTAQSYAYQRSEIAAATGKRFASQLKAYQAGPNYFKNLQRLLVLEEALKNTRKYIVVADKNDTQVFIVDLQEKLAPSLYDLGGIEENAQ